MAGEINNHVGEEFLQYLYVLDSTYTSKLIIDTFSDFLWTERYCGYGEFEITMPINKEVLDNCFINDYISIKESDKLMIVETISIHSDFENGAILKISGRTLESLIERRIVLDETIGTISEEGEPSKIGVQEAINIMLSHNIISPEDSNRQMPKFIFKESTDEKIQSLTLESFESLGERLYDKIYDICNRENLGFRVNAVDGGGYQFELYFGVDRTWGQDVVTPIIFSDSYDNLSDSDYLQTEKEFISTVYVKWDWSNEQETEDQNDYSENERETGTEVTEVHLGSTFSGLSRRESFITDSKSHKIGPKKIKDAAVNQVTERGKEYLSDYKTTEYFDGIVEPYRQFVYGVDYSLGDIVQLENRYGKTGKCRITEIVLSRDASGPNMTPTFETVEGDD